MIFIFYPYLSSLSTMIIIIITIYYIRYYKRYFKNNSDYKAPSIMALYARAGSRKGGAI